VFARAVPTTTFWQVAGLAFERRCRRFLCKQWSGARAPCFGQLHLTVLEFGPPDGMLIVVSIRCSRPAGFREFPLVVP